MRQVNCSSTTSNQLCILLSHLDIVNYASARYTNAANAGGIGFKFTNLVGGQHPQPFQSILVPASVQFVEPWQFPLRSSDDYFAADVVRHGVFLTKALKRFPSLNAKFSLQASWLVIDPGVDNSTVVARLMARNYRFFLNDCERNSGKTVSKLKACCQADDTSTDNCNVHLRRNSCYHPCSGRFRKVTPANL